MVKKLIHFNNKQINYINKQALKYGKSFSEYLRDIVMFDMMMENSERKVSNIKGGERK